MTAQVGQTVQYQIVVTNTGDIAETAHVSDGLCDRGTFAVSNAPSETIAPGASISYICSHKVVAADGASLTNVAVVRATAANGVAVGPQQSQVVANVQAAQQAPAQAQTPTQAQAPTQAQTPKGVLGASKTIKTVKNQAKPAPAKVRAARFTG